MTTNYIDIAFHAAAFPATYTVPGALQALGVTTKTDLLVGNILADLEDDDISGYVTSAGNAIVIPIGFNPVRVKVINWTDGIAWEWMWGAPATDSAKFTTAADLAVDGNSQIVVTTYNGTPGSVASVTLGATLAGTSKVLSFRIEG